MMSEAASHIPTASPVQRSPWHSPVPYLFGGLAAMLGLIAFALLILACSYWKLSGYLDNNGGDANSGEPDLELGEIDEKPKLPPVMEEKFLVIMAGQEKPTFLATPISSRASSFGSNCSSCGGGSSSSSSSEMSEKTEEGEDGKERLKQGSGLDQVQVWNPENLETADQIP
jgi:hypothetical protein